MSSVTPGNGFFSNLNFGSGYDSSELARSDEVDEPPFDLNVPHPPTTPPPFNPENSMDVLRLCRFVPALYSGEDGGDKTLHLFEFKLNKKVKQIISDNQFNIDNLALAAENVNEAYKWRFYCEAAKACLEIDANQRALGYVNKVNRDLYRPVVIFLKSVVKEKNGDMQPAENGYKQILNVTQAEDVLYTCAKYALETRFKVQEKRSADRVANSSNVSSSNLSSSESSVRGINSLLETRPAKFEGGRMNQEWIAWKERQNRLLGYNALGTTVPNLDIVPPLICSMEEKFELEYSLGQEVCFTPQMNRMLEILKNPNYAMSVGLDPDDIVDSLGSVLAKYEVPIGLSRLFIDLANFDYIEFIVDDSGSMMLITDSWDINRMHQRRGDGALSKVLKMIEVLCYIKVPKIKFRFLNYNSQKVCLELDRRGQAPEDFFRAAKGQIEHMWTMPEWRHKTPMREALENSYREGQGKKVARYVFGDGVPSDPGNSIEEIHHLLLNRRRPEGNPTTFISCSDYYDEETKWMEELEVQVPFCSFVEDYRMELSKVLRNQGGAFPYTYGFHIVRQLVGAINPTFFENCQDGVPYTKYEFDSILGYITSTEIYRRYFDEITRTNTPDHLFSSREDRSRTRLYDRRMLQEFVKSQRSTHIKEVKEYRSK